MTDLAVGAQDEAAALGEAIYNRSQILNDEQKKLLSKTLFPDTHTDTVEICGRKRTLRPLTIKPARQLSSVLEELQARVQDGTASQEVVKLDLLNYLIRIGEVLAEWYGWEDVSKAIREEDVQLTDLQALTVRQVRLQDSNDFLLSGLRVLVGVMQIAEIETIHWQSIFSGQLSPSITAAPSTS